MLLEPKETENIVVGVRWQGCFAWYVTIKDYWFMDEEELEAACIQKMKEFGLSASIPVEGEPEREGIPVLDEKTVVVFLPRIEPYRVSVDELRECLRSRIATEDPEDVHFAFLPSLYVDFDSCCLYSMYTEPASFEDFVPRNWEGKHASFLDLVDHEQKYWYFGKDPIFDFQRRRPVHG